MKILIVEDDSRLAENIRDILEQERHEVTIAHDSPAAMQLAQPGAFALGIIDLKLADTTGLELVERLSRTNPDAHFIIITAYASLETAIRAVRQPRTVSYETKPLDFKRILFTIRQSEEHQRLEKLIRDYQEELRAMVSRMSVSEEAERHRIAMEIHDGVGQTLSLCNLRIALLAKIPSFETQAQAVEEVQSLFQEAIRELRTFMFELSPPILYDLGLEPAVEELAGHILAPANIQYSVSGDGQTDVLGRDMRVILFQAVRELLRNIIKHARANKVTVDISREENLICIEIDDNGVGLDCEIITGQRKTPGCGLSGLRERLKYLGGSLEGTSRPGQGTHIVITAPIKT